MQIPLGGLELLAKGDLLRTNFPCRSINVGLFRALVDRLLS